MNMRKEEIFSNGDEPFLSWMKNNSGGFVLNTGKGDLSHYAVLHTAGCHHLTGLAQGHREDSYTKYEYIKVCALGADVLYGWMKSNRPTDCEFSYCGTCFPRSANDGNENGDHDNGSFRAPHTIEAIDTIVQSLLTDKQTRKQYLLLFREAIRQADWFGNAKWCVHTMPDRLRLIVGRIIVCTVCKNKIWLALDTEQLHQQPDLKRQIDHTSAWEPDNGSYAVYKQVRSLNGYYTLNSDASVDLRETISRLHFAFIANVAQKHETLNRRSRLNHSSLLLDYLEHALDEPMPGANHADLLLQEMAITSESNELPVTRRVETTSYQIVRDAAKANWVKRLHHYSCQICGHSIGSPDHGWYAEAHHIKPLGSQHNGPDIIENIICVCPNHHAELDYGLIDLDRTRLKQHHDHKIADEYIDYHNSNILKV